MKHLGLKACAIVAADRHGAINGERAAGHWDSKDEFWGTVKALTQFMYATNTIGQLTLVNEEDQNEQSSRKPHGHL